MRIRVWGARGSSPVSGPGFVRFGHHTSCIELEAAGETLVFDIGSGAADLGPELAQRGAKRVHVLLSHFHHDHTAGLPFFLLSLGQEAEIVVHCAIPAVASPRRTLMRLFSPPYFPLPADEVFARVRFRKHLPDVPFRIGRLEIRATGLDHPGGSTAYRVADGSKSVVYATDIENALPPQASLVRFVAGADLLIHDTMFTSDEAAMSKGWGHSTPEAAAALAKAGNVRRLMGFHHGTAHDDAMLLRHEAHLASLFPGASLLREGQELTL